MITISCFTPESGGGSNLKKEHLKIIDDDYCGGKKAVCMRLCTKDDLKPLDCEAYPYFPRIKENGEMELLKGKKCPLNKEELANHKKELMHVFGEMLRNKAMLEWLKKVEQVGYEVEE